MTGMATLGVCAIFKNEAPNLAEWLRFHRLVGVERFYLYNNDSSDDWKQAIYDSGEVRDVTVIHAPGRERQVPAYGDCHTRFGPSTRWIAYIDCDEFLFPTDCGDLRTLLADYEKHPGLVANWMMFGSSGYRERPEGLTTQRYTRRGRSGFVVGNPVFLRAPGLDPSVSSSYRPMNTHVKTIAQSARAVRPLSPHHFEFRDGAPAVNESGEPVPIYWSDRISVERLRINHYWSKSLAELERKTARGYACAGRGVSQRYASDIERLMNVEIDTTIFPLARRLPGWDPMFGAVARQAASA